MVRLFVTSVCDASMPPKPFWEKGNRIRVERERKNAINSGHYVLTAIAKDSMQFALTKRNQTMPMTTSAYEMLTTALIF